jgi:hypothetical protein
MSFQSENPQATASDALTSEEQQKLEAGVVLFRDGKHPLVQALHRKIDQIAHPSAQATAMKKLDAAVVDLQKADSTGTMTRTQAIERVRKDDPRLMREIAAATRPVAA